MIQEFINAYFSPTTLGFFVELVVVILLILAVKYKPAANFTLLFELAYEKIYEFYSEIIWEKEKKWIKTYVVVLFFVILISNLIWIVIEFLAPIFGTDTHGEFILEHYITIPSADINFNLALAIVSIVIILSIQFNSLWLKKFILDYFPIFWKNYITLKRGKMKAYFYYPLKVCVKTFDIVISFFLSFLEIVGLLAKIISLAFRLFWNMTAWTILLAMLVVGTSNMTTDWFGFSFPVVLPVLIYLQELLIALIQAVVFSLLIAIFIRVSKSN